MSGLQVAHLSVAFGGRQALREVSITLDQGAALGVIGPNGAGKTTLIDAITGFVNHEGRVLVDGVSVDGLAPHRRVARGLARTFQALELFDDLSVRENVAVGPATTWATVDAALAAAGFVGDAGRLAGLLPRPARGLVALGRALACQPRVLLLDEIAAGLDVANRVALAERLSSVMSSGVALLVVDHDLAFVGDVCGHVVVLDAGEVIARGTPADVRRDARVLDAYLGRGFGPSGQGQ